jgi:hypothetical protein
MSGSSSTTRSIRFDRRTASLLSQQQHRQLHRKGARLPALAIRANRAFVLIDDGIAGGKPEAYALARRSLGVERIEDFVEVLRRDLSSGVSDANHQFPVDPFGGDVDRAPVRQGVHGVEEQVDENLLQEAGNAQYSAGRWAEVRANFDILNLGLVLYLESVPLSHGSGLIAWSPGVVRRVGDRLFLVRL